VLQQRKHRDASKSLSLEPVALEKARVKLSDFNQLTVKSIELFEASATDVEMQHLGNGHRKIELQ
jgi:hypothetical protein